MVDFINSHYSEVLQIPQDSVNSNILYTSITWYFLSIFPSHGSSQAPGTKVEICILQMSEWIDTQRKELICSTSQLVSGRGKSKILSACVSSKRYSPGRWAHNTFNAGLSLLSALSSPWNGRKGVRYLSDAIMLHFNHMEGVVGRAAFLIKLHVSCQAFKPYLEGKAKCWIMNSDIVLHSCLFVFFSYWSYNPAPKNVTWDEVLEWSEYQTLYIVAQSSHPLSTVLFPTKLKFILKISPTHCLR